MGMKGAQAQAARNACLEWSKPIEPLPPRDERIVTRLGLDDRTVELPTGTIGPFGGEISLLSISGRWLRGVAVDAPSHIAVALDGLSIAVGDRKFIYNRLGLRLA